MNEKNGFKTPTPADTLEQQIIDPSFPKNEREWWASEEIARLRAEVEALRADAQTKDALLDRAHDLLEFIGCSPEGARNDILMAKMLQRDIDAARAVQGDKT
jgi:hypothetical protein